MLWCSGISKAPQDINHNISLAAMDLNARNYNSDQPVDPKLHMSNLDSLKLIASDGMIELYFDPISYAVSIFETTTGFYWHSLPTDSKGDVLTTSVLSIEMEQNGKYYVLNSQDHSVALGGASTSNIEVDGIVKGISVTYLFAVNQEDITSYLVDPSNSSNGVYELTVRYELKDGSLFTELDCSKVKNLDTSHLLNVRFLEYFGCSESDYYDGFMLVPDGSGAIIDLNSTAGTFEQISLPMYGNNLTVNGQSADDSQAILPVFGIKKSQGAFIAIIEEGDALATVKAYRGLNSSYNKVFAGFTITDSLSREIQNYETGEKEHLQYFAKKPYQGSIRMCYRFLSKTNANYTGMSISCREQLIRNGTLSTKTAGATDYLPFNLTIIGTSDKSVDAFSVQTKSTKVLTSFDEALDMVTQMRAKGINNINVRYQGLFTGGNNQSDFASATLNSRLGSKKSYNELCEYMSELKLSLFADLNILTSSVDSMQLENNAAGTILYGEATYKEANTLHGLIPYVPDGYVKQLISPTALADSVASFIKKNSKTAIDGICINDAGKLLYSDFSGNYLNREETKNIISSEITPLNTNRNRMVSVGNAYMLKQADYVVDVPVPGKRCDNNTTYKRIPFLQMVLHGTLEYSLTPINSSEDSQIQMLRSVEYGALPHFEWVYDDIEGEVKESHYYANWLTIAADFYQKAHAALYDLRDVRMVNNYNASSKVMCTEYENGVSIYVNYSDEAQTVEDVTIPAWDFVRVG